MQKKYGGKNKVAELEELAKNICLGRAWVGLKVQNKIIAKLLLRQWEEIFQQWASVYGVEEFRLTFPEGYLSVPSSLTTGCGIAGLSTIGVEMHKSLWIHPSMSLNRPLLAVVERFVESDRPMFLTSNDTDDQLWINQLACDMIESDGAEAVRRCMRNYVEAGDLALMHQKLRDTTQPFEHRYRAILNDENPDTWFEAVSRFEPVVLNGRSFRLITTQDFKILGVRGELTVRGAR